MRLQRLLTSETPRTCLLGAALLLSLGGCRTPAGVSKQSVQGKSSQYVPTEGTAPLDRIEVVPDSSNACGNQADAACSVIQCTDQEPVDSLADYLRPASMSPNDATDVSRGMTLADLEAIALQAHPAIQRQSALVDAARGKRVQAGLPFNPVLQFQSDEIGNDRSSGLHSLSISQQFVTANKLGIAQRVECHEIQKQQAQLRIEELKVLLALRRAFNQCLVAQQRRSLTDQILVVAEKSVAAVEKLVEVGEASRLALLQVKVQVEQARIESNNAETNYQATLRILAAATGDRNLVIETLVGTLPIALDDRPWEVLTDKLLSTSPEIPLAGSELQRARSALELACAQVIPDVTGRAGVGFDAATDNTFAVVGVSVPLPIRNRNQGEIHAARARVAAAASDIERTELSLETRLAGAVGRYQVAREKHDRLNEAVLPNAEEAYELALQAYRVGEVAYLQLLTAQQAMFSTRLSRLDALREAMIAGAEIDTALVDLSR
ncbi:MAG: TolC family protein [Planctomycetota bacterium]